MATTPQPDASAILAPLQAGTSRTGEAWFAFAPGDGGPDLPVDVRLGQQPTGRYVCTGLVIGDFGPASGVAPREVNAAALRSIRMPQLIRAVLDYDTAPAEGDTDAERVLKAGMDFTVADIPPVGPRPGRVGWSPEHFEQFAADYRTALVAAPHRPTAWLAEQRFEGESTIRRKRARAIRDGYLTQEETNR